MLNNKLTSLLVYLLVISFILQGCTVIGISMGEKADIRRGERAGACKDLSELTTDDYVEITLLDGEKFRGEVKAIRSESFLIRYLEIPKPFDDKMEEKWVLWENIITAEKLESSAGRSVLGAVIGMAIDVTFLFLAKWYFLPESELDY